MYLKMCNDFRLCPCHSTNNYWYVLIYDTVDNFISDWLVVELKVLNAIHDQLHVLVTINFAALKVINLLIVDRGKNAFPFIGCFHILICFHLLIVFFHMLRHVPSTGFAECRVIEAIMVGKNNR